MSQSLNKINQMAIKERPIRFSVACNFDPQLPQRVAPYGTYELFGKFSADYFGGGRPSFYLPNIDKKGFAKYVSSTHDAGIEFNYLLNSSSMDNLEFTTEGQRELRKLLDWLSELKVDSITVANLYFLRLIKKLYPHFGVRISSHRETDNPRKVRFWAENGADCVVISETTIHRELEILQAMRDAVKVDLCLIVNNWCRQDCAIASNHAVLLSNASRNNSKKGFPLDYCSVYCNAWRLEEPVNYIRANWIRPEDLHYYTDMGYTNFKVVERNTPTDLLEMRTRAYYNQRYDGNLLDLCQNYAYPKSAFKTKREKGSFALASTIKHFAKPLQVNMMKFPELVDYGKKSSMIYPRESDNPVYINNRALDGFMERFETKGCENVDCESCRYCHVWAERSVHIEPKWRKEMTKTYDGMLNTLHSGELWEPYSKTLADKVKGFFNGGISKTPARKIGTGGEAVPKISERFVNGQCVAPNKAPCSKAKPKGALSIGNKGLEPNSAARL